MRFRYPDSFTRLLLLSFVVVCLPLLLALGLAARDLQRTVERSEKAVYEAAQSGRNGRLLTEQLRQMERTLRRYLVLGEPELLAQFDQLHLRFRQTLEEMAGQQLGEVQLKQLKRLADSEAQMAATLRANPRQPGVKEAAGRFAELSELSQAVMDEAGGAIDREVEQMRASAQGQRSRVLWLALAALPLAALAALAFTWVIARPVRQIDGAIRRLGDADFGAPVEVTGPRDLEYLGQRLNWLRLRLAELEEQKARFLRGVSHELKTPLTALREGAELLGEGAAGELSEEQRALVSILRNKSLQLQGLIDDLLNFHQAASRAAALRLSRFDLAQVARTKIAEQSVSIAAKGLRVTAHLESMPVVADADKIATILDNLLTNAVKFSPRGGEITLRAMRVGQNPAAQNLVLEVQDQGPGVAPGEEERIFELFYQGKHRPQAPVPGSGLGLAIARELALLHGGSLMLAHVGPAACFRLTLPLRAGLSPTKAGETAHA